MLHENITADGQKHFPKGWEGAAVWSYPIKTAAGKIEWFGVPVLPQASDLVSSIAAPPAETLGKTYLINNAVGDLTVSAINWQSGTTVRYTFSGSPDLSAVGANDYFFSSGAANSVNDVTAALISTVNDGSDYIEITNPNVTDATDDETTGATSNVTAAEWDGAPINSWVRFGALTWENQTSVDGMACYLVDQDSTYEFDGSTWASAVGAVSTLAQTLAAGNTTGGTDLQVSTGDDLIIDDLTTNGLMYDNGSKVTNSADLTYDGDEFKHTTTTGIMLSSYDGYTPSTNWWEVADRSGLIAASYSRAGHWTIGRPLFSDFYIDGNNGNILMANLPTSSAGLPSGALWNNSNVVNIV